MAPKVFIIGATGFIGGDVLYTVNHAHPDWELTCLVRSSDKGAQVAAQYPKVRLVYGTLDSEDLIAEEAAKADIVYAIADCDDTTSASAIIRGLSTKTTPSWLIHTSGTNILSWETASLSAWGQALPKVYNDFSGIHELLTLPHSAPHRPVDEIILSATANAENPLIHTAIICPPTIYGLGRGPCNQDSNQAPNLASWILKRGEGFSCRGSSNIWCQVHVHDLSALYLKLGEAAASNNGHPATWNQEGYYFCESGTFVWGEVIAAMTKYAHEELGLVKSSVVRSLEPEEIRQVCPEFLGAIGANSIGDAIRARHLLGWEPKVGGEKNTLLDTVPEVVERAAKKLGLMKGHGQVVAEEVKF